MKKENKAIWLCLSFKLAPFGWGCVIVFVAVFIANNRKIRHSKRSKKKNVDGIIAS